MRKIIIFFMFTILLTGCDLAYNQQLNQDQIEIIKSEIYNELKSSLEMEQTTNFSKLDYEELENEIIEKVKLDIYNELNLLIDEKQVENELLFQQINQRIDKIINDSPSEALLKQELELYVNELVYDLSINLKQDLVNEINLNNQINNELQDFETMIINVVNKNTKGVLGISNYQLNNGRLQEVSTGSGVIYKKMGNEYFLVTNEHVVRDSVKLKVVLENNVYLDATLLGKDLKTDLAVMKFTSTYDLPVAIFADSNLLTRGQIAIAIGSPLGYDFYGTVTMGVISGLSRQVGVDYNEDGTIDFVEVLIQHDVAINPGNSGGPLYNIYGEIIGINNMKSIEANVDNIGFAIPSNTVVEKIKLLE